VKFHSTTSTDQKLLTDGGSVSHDEVMAKAKEEYDLWREHTLSPVEQSYLETIKQLGKKKNDKKA